MFNFDFSSLYSSQLMLHSRLVSLTSFAKRLKIKLCSSLFKVLLIWVQWKTFWNEVQSVRIDYNFLRAAVAWAILATTSSLKQLLQGGLYCSNLRRLSLFFLRIQLKLFVTRRRRRGAIEMTLVCPCVRPSVRPSFRPSFRPPDLVPATPLTSFIGLIWNFIDCLLIIWRCVWFLFRPFLSMLWPLLTHTFPRNSCHIFYRIDLKLSWMFHHDLEMCMWFWIFSSLIFDKVTALSHFLAIFQLMNRLTEKAEIWWAISICYTDHSDNG